MPDVSGASAVNTGVHTSLPQRTPGCGCIRHPAFPAPSRSQGGRIPGKARAITPRGRGDAPRFLDIQIWQIMSGSQNGASTSDGAQGRNRIVSYLIEITSFFE